MLERDCATSVVYRQWLHILCRENDSAARLFENLLVRTHYGLESAVEFESGSVLLPLQGAAWFPHPRAKYVAIRHRFHLLRLRWVAATSADVTRTLHVCAAVSQPACTLAYIYFNSFLPICRSKREIFKSTTAVSALPVGVLQER